MINEKEDKECCECGEILKEGDGIEHKNLLYCRCCFDVLFLNCEWCNNYVLRNFSYYCQGDSICDKCASEDTFICDRCGERLHNDAYEADGYCSSCYEDLEEEEEPENIEIPFKIGKSKTFDKNPFKNTCGIEIECINKNKHEFYREELKSYGFSQLYDGSLNSNGVEFRSNAFNGDLLFNKIDDFLRVLNRSGFKIDKSCGLHIHIKIPQSVEYLKKIAFFYQTYEPFFFNMLPDSRRDNFYCKNFSRMYKSINLKDRNYYHIKSKVYNSKDKSFQDIVSKEKYNDSRYCWVNLHSVFYRGTLEIRNHSGTLNADKIKKWLLIHLTCLEFLNRLPSEIIFRLPKNEMLFLSLFPRELKEYIINRWQKFYYNSERENTDSLNIFQKYRIDYSDLIRRARFEKEVEEERKRRNAETQQLIMQMSRSA